MLRERIAIGLLLLPLLLWVIGSGGILYLIGMLLVLTLAAAEFAALFRSAGQRPATPLILIGVLLLTLQRGLLGFEHAPLLITALVLMAMTWHLVDFECGAPRSGTDFALTITAILYLGWIGSYLVSLRSLEDGAWWVMLALPAVWFADSGAYFVGRALGKRKLAPRLSPKKTWEGYLAGIFFGGLLTAGFASIWQIAAANPAINPGSGMLIGLVIGTIAPLGDLGISMIKREVMIKDSGALLPGHGGALDRIDSWLWAGVLGFYLASWLLR